MDKEYCQRYAATALQLFDTHCMQMAEQNWCPAQVKMLRRLFDAVSMGMDYDKVPERKNQKTELMKQCEKCENLEYDKNGLVCMVVNPNIINGKCKSFEAKAEK